MSVTAPRAIVSRTLTRAGLTMSKSSPSMVKGLPLRSRGFYLDTIGDTKTRVRWTAGSGYSVSARDLTEFLDRAEAALSTRDDLAIERTGDALFVSRV